MVILLVEIGGKKLNKLYKAKTPELLQAIKDAGIDKDDLDSCTCLYVKDGVIKATNNKKSVEPDVDEHGLPMIEHIGFWLWTSSEVYKKAQDREENVFGKINVGWRVNIEALREMYDD